jgi:hypothetical protein
MRRDVILRRQNALDALAALGKSPRPTPSCTPE